MFTLLAVFLRLIGQKLPIARRLAGGLLFRLAPHTMLRIVFVAEDRYTWILFGTLFRDFQRRIPWLVNSFILYSQ